MSWKEEEIEDLSTCSVCLTEYDENKNKPKFLQCFHTLCLRCLEAICRNGSIICPLCRSHSPCPGGASQLKNNPHAIQLIELRKELNKKSMRSQLWCLTCASVAASQCNSDHQTLEIPVKDPSVGQELQAVVGDCQRKLTQLIEKRRGLHGHFLEILNGMKAFEDSIKFHTEENEMRMAELMSILDTVGMKSAPTETYHLMKSRIDDSLAESDREIARVNEQLNVLQMEKNIRRAIQMEAMDKCQVLLKNDPLPTAVEPTPSVPTASQYTFVLEVNDEKNLVGEIHVEPNSKFDKSFIKKLSQFCELPKKFKSRIVTATPETLLLLDFDNDGFRSSAPIPPDEMTESSLDIGMIPMTEDDQRWQLVFYVKDVDAKMLGPFPLFGKVVDGSHVIAALTRRASGKGLSVTWKLCHFV